MEDLVKKGRRGAGVIANNVFDDNLDAMQAMVVQNEQRMVVRSASEASDDVDVDGTDSEDSSIFRFRMLTGGASQIARRWRRLGSAPWICVVKA